MKMEFKEVASVSFEPEEYVVASSVDQVVTLLKEHKEKARIIAGGTIIHELSFRGLPEQTNNDAV